MKRGKKKKRTGLYIVVTVVMLFLGMLVVQGNALNANCKLLQTQKVELEAKKADLLKDQQSIKEKQEYVKSTKYIEDLAREKFGLVYSNEIVFKAATNEK